MSQVLSEEVKDHPIDIQDILTDDLLTAFENRLIALRRATPTNENAMMVGLDVPQ